MDEPSTGMDPQSKRFVWDCIQESFKVDRGAILTTHSMEEADAICSRIGIMVNGELKCLGSSQDLKNKFGGGYNLHIKWLDGSEDDWSRLVSRIEEMFPEAERQESLPGSRLWIIHQEDLTSLRMAFINLQTCNNKFNLNLTFLLHLFCSKVRGSLTLMTTVSLRQPWRTSSSSLPKNKNHSMTMKFRSSSLSLILSI